LGEGLAWALGLGVGFGLGLGFKDVWLTAGLAEGLGVGLVWRAFILFALRLLSLFLLLCRSSRDLRGKYPTTLPTVSRGVSFQAGNFSGGALRVSSDSSPLLFVSDVVWQLGSSAKQSASVPRCTLR
jgi:hypothetical protein